MVKSSRPTRCSSILNDILDFSKIEARQAGRSRTVAFSLRDSRRKTPSAPLALSGALQQKPTSLELVCPHPLPRRAGLRSPATPAGSGKSSSTSSGNAIKFTDRRRDRRGRPRGAPRREERPAAVRQVSDTGIGIPADKQLHDLPAVRAGRPRRRRARFGGTGLGLAIATQLVANSWAGSLSVDQRTRGAAATFHVQREALP